MKRVKPMKHMKDLKCFICGKVVPTREALNQHKVDCHGHNIGCGKRKGYNRKKD